MTTELQATANTPWVLVDKHENLITSGGGSGTKGTLFVYPSMVPEAYDEFFRESGGYGCLDDDEAIEKLHAAVEEFVIGWEQQQTPA